MIRFFSITALLCLVVAGILGLLGWRDYNKYLETPVNLSNPIAANTNSATQSVSFTVEPGWSAKRVGSELHKAGIIDKPHWFDMYARLSKKAAGIKTGEYVLSGKLTVPELFETFQQGRTRQYTHTVIEGDNWKQLLSRLAQSEHLKHTLENPSVEQLMQAIGHEGWHPEGQFFADTYAFPKNTTDVEYLKRAKNMLDQVLAEEWENRQEGLPLETPYEALILASIVEKETAVAEERPLIAQVFLSRLVKRMRLQTDPTVIYGMGDSFDGDIRRKDLTTDTPYNTYTRSGLPPTPISMVGREAIHAVLHPEPTTALFFVARGDGTHQFSDTNEQHNAAVRKYQLKR